MARRSLLQGLQIINFLIRKIMKIFTNDEFKDNKLCELILDVSHKELSNLGHLYFDENFICLQVF